MMHKELITNARSAEAGAAFKLVDFGDDTAQARSQHSDEKAFNAFSYVLYFFHERSWSNPMAVIFQLELGSSTFHIFPEKHRNQGTSFSENKDGASGVALQPEKVLIEWTSLR
jgi:hypothetical protein